MKIAVVAANGNAGRLIVDEALSRGLDVTAVVRGENKTKADKSIIKDIFSLTKEDLKDFDVVVDAFGQFNPEHLDEHSTTLKHLSDLVSGTDTRLLVVGGAGSLYVDEAKSIKLLETEGFQAEYLPLASAMGKALEELRLRKDVKWTYISPAADFDLAYEKKGKYILAGEIFTLNENNESKLSYADYAIALVDEIEAAKHIQERISVLS